MNKVIILLVLLVFVSLFAVINAESVNVNFFFTNLDVSLALVIFISVLFGAMMAFLVSLLDRFKKYKQTDSLKKSLKECEKKVVELENTLRLKEENHEIIQEQVE